MGDGDALAPGAIDRHPARGTWSTFLDPSLKPPEIRPWGSKALINACMDYRLIKNHFLAAHQAGQEATYEHVVARWSELGLARQTAGDQRCLEDKTSAKDVT